MFKLLKRLFTKAQAPAVEFRDAELGILTGEGDIWNGTVIQTGKAIPFTVAGTTTAPDGALLDRVRDIVRDFAEIESKALTFLRTEAPEIRAANLTFHGLGFLWEDRPDIFAFEWLADGDGSCVWRVNFEDGKPKEAGFDD